MIIIYYNPLKPNYEGRWELCVFTCSVLTLENVFVSYSGCLRKGCVRLS